MKIKSNIKGQINLAQLMPEFDTDHKYSGKPDYRGFTDEINRYSIELDFELAIPLDRCPVCKVEVDKMFRSCKEYFVKCPKCGKRTAYYKYMYQAMQAWNNGVFK